MPNYFGMKRFPAFFGDSFFLLFLLLCTMLRYNLAGNQVNAIFY